jgi:DNA-binding MarR family transcriptional regulator
MDHHAYYELQLLRHLEQSPDMTHRVAADKLGVSVKLVNSVIRGLLHRGFIHATRRDGRSLCYFMTPEGIREEMRLTYEFLDFSRQFFREARSRSSAVCRDLRQAGIRNVAFLGCGDLAEIAFLGVKEHDLRLTAVFAGEGAGNSFLGLPVRRVAEIPDATVRSRESIQRIIVTAFDPAEPMRELFLPAGVRADERFVWVFDHRRIASEIARHVPRQPARTPGPAGSSDQDSGHRKADFRVSCVLGPVS